MKLITYVVSAEYWSEFDDIVTSPDVEIRMFTQESEVLLFVIVLKEHNPTPLRMTLSAGLRED